MILNDPDPIVIKRYTDRDYVGGPTFEVSAKDPKAFSICLGGDDYYASEDRLNLEQATRLRDVLNEWIATQEAA